MEKEIRAELDKLENDSEKISFLEEQLDKDELEQDAKAIIYELLGDLYAKAEQPKGELFEKAASAWEIFSVSKKEDEKESFGYKKDALKFALKDYEKAVSMYKRANENALGEEAKSRAKELRKEIGHIGGPVRTLSVAGVLVIFFLSFIFLAQFPTGFAISPIEDSQTTSIGAVLIVLGILGTLFVVWRWR
jgi:hypothetical protein